MKRLPTVRTKSTSYWHGLVLAMALISGCMETPTAPSVAGYTVQSLASGERKTSVIVRGDTAFSARTNGAFEATLMSTGRVVWSTRVRDDGIYWWPTGVAVGRDHIFVAAGQDVVSIERARGRIAWRFNSPNVQNSAQEAISTDSTYIAFAQRGGRATVISAATGTVVWDRALLQDTTNSRITAPVFSNGVLVYSRLPAKLAPANGEVIALAVRAATGESLWTLRVNHEEGRNDYGGTYAIPIADGVILSTNDGLVLNLRATDGLVRWQVTSPSTGAVDYRAVTAYGNEVIAGSVANLNRVQSLDINTGRINWTIPTEFGTTLWGVAVNATSIALGTASEQMTVVDRATRDIRVIDLSELLPYVPTARFLGVPTFVGRNIVVSTTHGLLTLRPVK